MPPCPALPSTAATLHYVFSVVQQNSAKFVRLVARCTASVDTLYSWLWLVFCLPVPWPESCCREISPKKVAQSLASSRLPGVGVGFLFSFFFIFGLFCAFLSFSQNFQKPAFLCFFFPRGRFSATPPPWRLRPAGKTGRLAVRVAPTGTATVPVASLYCGGPAVSATVTAVAGGTVSAEGRPALGVSRRTLLGAAAEERLCSIYAW